MPTLGLSGHQFSYPASDILRLFYGPLSRTGPQILCAGPAEPQMVNHLEPAGPDCARIQTILGDRQISSIVPSGLAKREIKRQLYQMLSSFTGLDFPWGSLTGIRPTLIAAECLSRHTSVSEAHREMTEYWFVSAEKAGLALETAAAEQAILSQIPKGSLMVYIGVPFCPSRCAYCSFITQDALRQVGLLGPYVEALIKETSVIFQKINKCRPVSAVYIGGGTPTSLPDVLFDRLLRGVLPLLSLQAGVELTIEAGRPDTVTGSKLGMIRSYGATRLCINPQTFHDDTLARIGRFHSAEQTVAAFSLARSMGFDQVNMDLIAGLPGETPGDFADSLEQALHLAPESITVHTLSIKRSSRLRRQSGVEGVLCPACPDPGLTEMLADGNRRLKAAGMLPYYLYRQKDTAGGLENTGYARSGKACSYNVGMMSDRCTVIGLGSGAMTKIIRGTRVERLANPKSIADYINRIDELSERKRRLIENISS